MITTTQMYWLVILDNIIRWATALAIIAGGSSVFLGVGAALDEIPKWIPKTTIGVTLVSFLLLMFTPSTKQMAAIIVVPKIVNNEKVQVAGDRLYGLAVEWMNELTPKNRREAGQEKPDGK